MGELNVITPEGTLEMLRVYNESAGQNLPTGFLLRYENPSDARITAQAIRQAINGQGVGTTSQVYVGRHWIDGAGTPHFSANELPAHTKRWDVLVLGEVIPEVKRALEVSKAQRNGNGT